MADELAFQPRLCDMDSVPRSMTSAHTPASGLPDALQFVRLAWAVVHGLDQASRRMARHIGVTGPQRLVLRVVGLAPGASAGAVAAFFTFIPAR